MSSDTLTMKIQMSDMSEADLGYIKKKGTVPLAAVLAEVETVFVTNSRWVVL